MLIKKLDDCVDLPEKMPPQFIFLEDSRAQGLVGEEMRLLNKLTLSNIIAAQAMKDEVFRQKLEDKIEDDDSMNGLGFISEIRKLLGLSKVKESVKVLKQLLDDNDKIVVFCWHKEVAAQLFDGLEDYGPLMITGDTPNTTRDNYVKAFQTSKNHRVLVANIQAAGVGITLTSSSCVVFVEASWVPSDNDQAISRCHRVGQKRTVKPYYFVVRDSLDHMILNAHQEKNQVINKAIKPR
jgi:SWI/SNF-related matrix-associated actin-dependent regulator 1 of chromatin subfamily A